MRERLVLCLVLFTFLSKADAQTSTPSQATASDLETALRARIPAFERCRAERAQLGEPAEGRTTVRVTVRTNGNVWPATTTSDTTRNALLTGCVQSSFLSMRVAPRAQPLVVTFVLTFTSRGTSLGELTRVGGEAPSDATVRSEAAPPSALETAAALGNPRRRGEFDSDLVSAALMRISSEIRRCYERALRETPSLSGKVVVRFTIRESGVVEEVSISENTSGSAMLAECVRGAVASLRFSPGPVGGDVLYRYPFVFSPMNDGRPPQMPAPARTYEDDFTPPGR